MKHTIVFGGSRGIGASIAQVLLSNNYNVSIISRSSENMKIFIETVMENNAFHRPIALKADVRNEDAVNKAVTASEKWFGPASIVINAAGINRDNLLLKSKRTDILDIIETNLIGSMLTTKAVLKSMIKQKQGCIINIGSIVGEHGNSGQCAYSASKAGLTGFTKSLAKEVGSRGIRVNLIAPGFIETHMTGLTTDHRKAVDRIPLGRFGRPDEVANLAKFIIECEYLTGQVLYVDGGLHLNL